MALRSGITRGFDLSYPSNRFVLVATPALGMVAGLITLIAGGGWSAGIRNGFAAGGAAFLAWALARELHPDHPGVAALAALVAPLGVLRGGPDLLAAAVVLLGARVVAGTTGRVLRWVDVAVFVVVATPVAFRASGPAVLTTAALALAMVLTRQNRRRLETAVTVAVLAGLATLAWIRFDPAFEVDPWLIAPALLGLAALVGPGRVKVGTDREGGIISPNRVRAGRGVAWIAAAGAALALQPAAMAPVWAAVAATGVKPR
jgi:hypothetical protein